jgi:transposase
MSDGGKIPLTVNQSQILRHLLKCSTTEQRTIDRVKIIIEYDKCGYKRQVAKTLKISVKTVRKWVTRWYECSGYFNTLEQNDLCLKGYTEAIKESLNDSYRPGVRYKFTAEETTKIIAMACETLDDDASKPTSRWTHQELAKEAVRRGYVKEISRQSVGRILQEVNIKPHLSRYWLNAPDLGTEQFYEDASEVCEIYAQAEELHEQGVHIISTDENSGIQAIERDHKTHPAEPNKQGKELIEHNYTRHGTLCLFGNFEVATGKIIAPTVNPTRTEKDFAKHLAQTVSLDPEGKWIFIMDQLNTHMSESLVKWVAKVCNIQDNLGVKGVSGILKSKITRKEFLTESSHRIRIVYTPRHASWLNQIEIWFSIISRRLLKRGSFASIDELQHRILEFIKFFNETMAKPFKWTYRGRPLAL